MIDVRLQHEPIDVGSTYQQLVNARFGAVNMFVGTIREWTGDIQTKTIHYTAYKEMALKELSKLANEVEEKFDADVIVIHRLGELQLTDIAVFIGVATPHRAASYEGSRFIIEELKKRVPIWKEEVDTDRIRWGGERDDAH
ncbi:molybdenum cofactor biosynthesis protein MoaE [Listeria booriae]|uniref:molybdenum cofactor biosynthesis protein MoaE n=1 Tax=Listeria booriae TaxID=1552123 RepID=UPI001629B22B|nr:molybdenum cofactor biosynthesis protein MoaE [Listeria booriae]MBC1512689.1 molybdenum cofactor biosynthesis protein MoaE [Listeria booriae]MBC1944043.1 molybdenum cofactor biosynthesis protein MoaE [Listeria booriae]MBC6151455.1 molybdenum cofactor biosynthesis protein MoaE [Listeria booriae]MBC6305732.1 molybdenum cofactor biosynthesis protein MoaE [Listeria booriae]